MIAVITQASCYFKLERGICLKPKIDAFLGKKVRSSGERISECVCNFYVDMCTGRYAGVWRSLSFAMGVLSSRGGLRVLSGCGMSLSVDGVSGVSLDVRFSRSQRVVSCGAVG